jgi:hypothetical protein
MLKKCSVIPGIILFTASLFPLNAPAIDRTPDTAYAQSWTTAKEGSKNSQGKRTSHKKPKSTKRKA